MAQPKLITHWRLELMVSVPDDTPEAVLDSTAKALELAEQAIIEYADEQIAATGLPPGAVVKAE